jgi:clan AA aspartic protease (TIGR02281 family)
VRHRRLALLFLLVAAAGAGVLLVGEDLRRKQRPGVVDVEDAWVRVRASPRDPAAWAALGDAQVNLDQLLAAEESYRTALRLRGADGQLYARLGFMLYGWGRDEDALEALERASDLGADVPLLDFTLAQLRSELAPAPAAATAIEPPEASPPVDCEIPVTRVARNGVWQIAAEVNGVSTTLVVDTGASLTALDREMVGRVGAAIDEEHTIDAITAAGPAVFPTARVESITVAGRTVEAVRVAVCDRCAGTIAAGLLGLDVQAPRGMDLDIHDGVVHFGDCGAR